jgi:hypothetical protein
MKTEIADWKTETVKDENSTPPTGISTQVPTVFILAYASGYLLSLIIKMLVMIAIITVSNFELLKCQGARRTSRACGRRVFVVCLGGVGRKSKLVNKISSAEVLGRNGLQSLIGKRAPAFRGAKMCKNFSGHLARGGGKTEIWEIDIWDLRNGGSGRSRAAGERPRSKGRARCCSRRNAEKRRNERANSE